jgi:hypothetical protein
VGGGSTRRASCFIMRPRASRPPALRALSGILDLRVRVGAVERRFRSSGAVTLATDLDALLEAPPGVQADADALLACAIWLLNDGEPHLDALDALAVARKLRGLHALLENGAAHRSLARGGRLPEAGLSEVARVARHVHLVEVRTTVFQEMRAELRRRPELSAMEQWDLIAAASDRHTEEVRRIQALPSCERDPSVLVHTSVPAPRWVVRSQIARLAQHHSAFAIGRLLRDRDVLPGDVVTIAARRPTTAAIVRELTSHLGWIARADVRVAIALNPFTPLRTALILATTCRGRLRHAPAGTVHPRVSAAT